MRHCISFTVIRIGVKLVDHGPIANEEQMLRKQFGFPKAISEFIFQESFTSAKMLRVCELKLPIFCERSKHRITCLRYKHDWNAFLVAGSKFGFPEFIFQESFTSACVRKLRIFCERSKHSLHRIVSLFAGQKNAEPDWLPPFYGNRSDILKIVILWLIGRCPL